MDDTSKINSARVIVHDARYSIIRAPPHSLYLQSAKSEPIWIQRFRSVSKKQQMRRPFPQQKRSRSGAVPLFAKQTLRPWLKRRRKRGCGHARSAKTGYHMHLMVEVYIKAPSLRLFPPFLPSFSQHRTLNTTTTTHPEDQKDNKPIGPKDQKDDKPQGLKGQQNP